MVRKTLKSLILVVLVAFATSIFAQDHVKILVPNWETKSVSEVENGTNYEIPGSREFDGNRIPNLDQRITTIDDPYKFPSMVPLILYAKAPSGSKVVWNIDSDKVNIVGYAEGSEYISKNHVSTPVVGTSKNVSVENPYRVEYVQCGEKLNKYYDKNAKFIRDNFFIEPSGGGTNVKTKLFDANFNPKGYAYIIVIGTKNNETAHITATCKDKNADKESTAIAHVNFHQPPTLRLEDKEPCGYKLSITGRPEIAPIHIKPEISNSIKVNFTIDNYGSNTIDMSELVMKVVPEGNWTQEKFIDERSLSNIKKELSSGESLNFSKKFDINYDNVKGSVGSLTLTAKLLYPSSPNKGKSGDIDISYTKEEKEIPPKVLAGIATKIESAPNAGGLFFKFANTNNDNAAVLEILSISGIGRNYQEMIDEGDTRYRDFRISDNGGVITVKYRLFYNDEPLEVETLNINY